MLIGLLFITAVCGCLFIVLAGYVLGRKTGASIAFILLLLPGLLNFIGLWPAVPLAPEDFEIEGFGVTGNVVGMLSLVLLSITAGWSATILIVDSLRLRKKFWNVFDHVWLILGLLAAIFFVADVQVGQRSRRYSEIERDVQHANAYLLKQVETYDQWCHQGAKDQIASCRWASTVHQRLLDDSVGSLSLFAIFGPQSSAEFYGWYRHVADAIDIVVLRSEIGAYNQAVCPMSREGEWIKPIAQPSLRCEVTPAAFCSAWPDPIDGKVNMHILAVPFALATECVAPTLVALRKQGEHLSAQAKNDQRNRNYRWMYFLFFTLTLGGKLAGATAKLASLDDRPDHETRRVPRLIQRSVVLGWHKVQRVVEAIQRLRKHLPR